MGQTLLSGDAMLLRRVVEALPRYAYRFADEVTLHAGIATVLTDAEISFEREVVAGPKDRFDFLVAPGIVIEVKIKGSLQEALIQIKRYASRDDVSAVVLVTTRSTWNEATKSVASFHGKPIHLVRLRGMSF